MLDIARIADPQQFQDLAAQIAPRQMFEQALAEEISAGLRSFPGYCRVCRRGVHFVLPAATTVGVPNYREGIICPHCRLANRQRFVAAEVLSEADRRGTRAQVYAYEQRGALFQCLESHLEDRVVGSEYVGPDLESGCRVDGIRHEDATRLSFEDDSFDIVVSNDVFEHVPDVRLALREAHRVLRPGGVVIFSIPFHGIEFTEQRARLDGGEVVHLAAPEYHGDPMRAEGALVFYHFGWDLLDIVREAGFSEAYMSAYYSVMCGHIGEGLQYVFRAHA